MSKSQFNIKISKDLLMSVKRQAIKSGKSLTEHITDLVKKSLEENDDIDELKKINDFERRLILLESSVSNREYLSEDIKPFSNVEAVNCTKFMRGFFDKEVKKRELVDKNSALIDLISHSK